MLSALPRVSTCNLHVSIEWCQCAVRVPSVCQLLCLCAPLFCVLWLQGAANFFFFFLVSFACLCFLSFFFFFFWVLRCIWLCSSLYKSFECLSIIEKNVYTVYHESKIYCKHHMLPTCVVSILHTSLVLMPNNFSTFVRVLTDFVLFQLQLAQFKVLLDNFLNQYLLLGFWKLLHVQVPCTNLESASSMTKQKISTIILWQTQWVIKKSS